MRNGALLGEGLFGSAACALKQAAIWKIASAGHIGSERCGTNRQADFS